MIRSGWGRTNNLYSDIVLIRGISFQQMSRHHTTQRASGGGACHCILFTISSTSRGEYVSILRAGGTFFPSGIRAKRSDFWKQRDGIAQSKCFSGRRTGGPVRPVLFLRQRKQRSQARSLRRKFRSPGKRFNEAHHLHPSLLVSVRRGNNLGSQRPNLCGALDGKPHLSSPPSIIVSGRIFDV